MMRRLFFFALGLLLGSWSVWSFAAPTVAGSRVNLNVTPNAPSGVTLTGAWDAVVPGLEDTGYGGYRPGASAGSAEIYRGVAVRVDGVPVALEAKRGISARNLAKGALSLAKRGGPAGLIGGALVNAGLDWVADQWMTPELPPAYPYAYEFRAAGFSTWRAIPELACVDRAAIISRTFVRWEWISENSGWCRMDSPVYDSALESRARPCDAPAVKVGRDCVGGATPAQPATDQQLEDLLTDNLVDGDLTPEEALRELIESGNASDGDALNGYLDPVQASGPSSVSGPTRTSTTSSPAGQTETTTSTDYGIAYGPGGVVTITKGETTTTTTPDGQTTTTNTTESPAEGQNPKPADEKPFCELYPDAMACQPLGTPSPVELPTGTINVPGLSYESVTAACPAPYTFTPAAGGSYEISWQPVCDGAEAVRPAVIVIGLLTAGVFVFVGMRRGQS